MRITSLEIENFKSIDNLNLDLGNKVILVVGPNGSGKSSVLQAIQLLLTNSLNDKLSEYIRIGSNYFNIRMKFVLNGIDYLISYRYEKSHSVKELRFQDKCYRNNDCTFQLKNLINSDLLLYSCISEQGESYSLLRETPTKRLERLKDILGFSRLDKIVETTKITISNLRSDIDKLKNEITLLKNIQFDYIDDTYELEDINYLENMKVYYEKEKEKHDKNKLLMSLYESKQKDYLLVVSKINEIEKEIKNISSKYSEDLIANNESYKRDLAKVEIQIKEQDKQKNEYNSYFLKKANLEKNITNVKKELESIVIKDLPEFNTNDLRDIESKISSLDLEIRANETHVNLARKGKCHVCGQDFKHDVKKLENELKDKLQKKNELMDFYNKLKKIENEYNSAITNNSMMQNKKNMLLNQLKYYESEMLLLGDPPIVENTSDLLEARNNLLNLCSVSDKIISLVNEKKMLEKMDKPIEPVYIENCFDEVSYNDILLRISKYYSMKESKEKIRLHNEKVRERERQTKAEIQAKELEFNNKQLNLVCYEKVRDLLSKHFSSYLIDSSVSYIENKMNEFFMSCYNNKYKVEFSITDDKKSVNFYYSNVGNNVRKPVSMASGYERQLISMSFRYAISTMIGLSIMILDEVDSDASPENSKLLFRNLLDGNLFDQVFIVTHKEETVKMLLNYYDCNMIEM